MSEILEIKEFLEKIEIDKEVLSTMPKNNEKNINKYLEKIQEYKEQYLKEKKEIEEELNKRYNKATNIEEGKDSKNLTIRVKTIENILSLINDEKTSYEKMELDKIIYRISRFYKDNLENINTQIEMAIIKFAEVGVNLQPNDFNYSVYVEQYMKIFFQERKNENSNILKNKFEEIYWKCPDIIIHIELNLRNIYLQKKVQIDKYFEKQKEQLLKQWGKTSKEILNSYFEIKSQKIETEKKDRKTLLDQFLVYNLNIKDYSKENIQNNCAKILSPAMLEKLETNEEEVKKSIYEFLNSLYEYKNYMYFKFIIDDIKKHYNEKEKYKNIYEENKKKILESEKKLKKLNKKSFSRMFRRSKQEIKQSPEQNHIILEIRKQYKELDLNKFYNKIYSNLSENSTIYDVLYLANSYYNYLTKCIIENNKTITQEKIDDQITKLDEFLKMPYNNIINNLTFLEEKDISVIIKDRYQLLNFNIKQEDFNNKNIDNLIKILENIMTSFYLKEVNLKVEKIEEILKIKNTL